MTTFKFYESLKAIFYEVEVFVNSTLDGVTLTQKATIEKESILSKLRELQNEYPQLRTAASLPDTPKSPLNKEPAQKPNVKGPSVTSSVKEEEEEQEDGEIYADVEPPAPDSARSSHLTTTPSAASVSSSKKSTAASVSGESEDSQSICSSPVMTALEISSESPMTGYLVRKNLGKLDIKSMMQGLKATFLGKMYCVAYRGVFYLYDKVNSKRPADNIILHGYEVRPSSAEQTSKKEFSFELVCPGKKSYGFAAGSEEEMKKWVDVLNEESLKEPEIQAYTSKSKSSLASLTSPGSTNDDDTDDDEDYEDADGIAPPVPQQSGKKLQQHQQLMKSDKSGRSDKALPPQPGRQDKAPLPQPSRSDKPLPQTPGDQSDDDGEIYADIGPTEATIPSIKVQPVHEDNSVTLQDDFYDDAECAANRSAVGKESSQSTKNTNNDDDDDDDYDNKYYGKWDCRAESENEISFYCGDMVKVLSREYDKFGWWVAKAHGIIGLVPRDYLTPAYQLVS